MFRKLGSTVGRWVRTPALILSAFGIVGFLIDMLVKPISNAGLILLMVAAFPWLLKIVRRLKVGDYFEFESLTPTETQQRLSQEAAELEVPDSPTDNVNQGEESASSAAGAVDPSQTASLSSGQTNLSRPTATSQVFLAESLVIDWLQSKLRVPVQKYVRVGRREVDAVALTTPPTLIEVMLVNRLTSVRSRVEGRIGQLLSSGHEWKRAHKEFPFLELVVASQFTANSEDALELEKLLRPVGAYSEYRVDVRIVGVPDLLDEFGITAPQQ